LSALWRSWYRFRRGKKPSREIDRFCYSLEEQLYKLYESIGNLAYKHGSYQRFTVTDNKKREIAVAHVRDRIVHRLLYDYLVPIYDKTFIYDAWSCREKKGLLKAIERAQSFLAKYPNHYVWRSDITKFFDGVHKETLLSIIKRRISDPTTLYLLERVLESYELPSRPGFGIPIGNLTSQIFANIYLHEFDLFVKHHLKPVTYLRYGDDFLVVTENKADLVIQRKATIRFLQEKLFLRINGKNDIICLAREGLHFLGVELFPTGRRLKKRNWQRAITRVNQRNLGSYWGLIRHHSNLKAQKHYDWLLNELLP